MPRRARQIYLMAASIFVFSLVSACSDKDRHYSESFYIFGTIVEVIIRHEDKATAKAAVADVGELFRELHKNWHAWKEGGELTALNKAIEQGRPLQVSDQLADLIANAKTLNKDSSGLFDPAIGKVIGLWGFHADDLPRGPPPSHDEIAALRISHPSMDDVTVTNGIVRCRNNDVALDFGGFAKGAAIDLAAKLLKKHSIKHAIINAGGDLNVIGANKNRPWRIAIRDPLEWGALGSIEAKPGEAIYTSGNYERYRKHDGLRFSHIIDPRDFRPVHDIISATVIHHSGARADAAATALSVAGTKEWRRVADKMGVRQALLISADGKVHMTADMRERVRFKRPATTKAIVGDQQ